MEIQEVAIDFIKEEPYLTATVSTQRYINRTKKLKEKYPTLVEIRHTNEDGSMVVRFPAEWFKFPSPPKTGGRTFTEEEKKANAERLRQMHRDKKAKKDKE